VHETGTHNDPTIQLLEHHIQSIASKVPQSFALMRAGRFTCEPCSLAMGRLVTINPADLNSPIVVVLAATEHDVSQYQLILTAAILKRALEDAKSVTDPSETQLRIRRQEMDKFAFNRLPGDREISGPQAVSLVALTSMRSLPRFGG